MASEEGPTTVGSINAKLTLDADDFERKMRQAGELADRLDGRDIHVQARADVARAITELEALDAAEQRVSATGRAGAQSTAAATQATAARTVGAARHASAAQTEAESLARVEIAERRLQASQLDLDRVQNDGHATQQRLLRAQNAAANAGMQFDRALANRQQAVRDAAEAERAATAVTDAAASATDRNTSSTDRNTDSKKAQFSWMQALLAASPLLLAASAELAAGATGMGVAFVGMGAAGAAAIKGIKDQMKQGTIEGSVYSAGLTQLKGDLDQLSSTAAVALMGSFDKAVGDINGKMPFLNQLTGEMATQLGQIGGGLLSAVLDGLRNMSPLITAGAQGLGDFVGWLGHFTNEDGFHQFVAYGVQTLPQVITFLENVVTLAGRLIAAFAPLGPVVIGALNGIIGVLNALPLPILAGLVQAAMFLGPAFTIAKGAVALFGQTAAIQALNVSLFGTAVNLAVPVVGILVAALAGLAVGFAVSATSQQHATVSASEYADALERDGNAIGKYTTQLAVKKLAESGAYDAVSRLGLGTDALTKAVTGNGDALKIIQSRIDEVNGAYKTAATNNHLAGTQMSQALKDQKAAADELGPSLNANIAAIQQQQHVNELAAAATKDSSQASKDKAIADEREAQILGVTVQQYQTASTAQADAAQKTRDTTLAMQVQNDAAGLLKQAWDELNGKTISAAQAQNNFDSQLANMGDHVDKVGKQITFTTTSINDQSAASVALRGQLIGQVNALEAVVEKNGDLQGATAQSRGQYEEMRQEIIDNAVAHGVDRDAVSNYIDTLFKVPPLVQTKVEADTAAAAANVAALQAQIDNMRGRVIDIVTRNSTLDAGSATSGAQAPTLGGHGVMVPQAFGGWAGGVAYLAAGGAAHPYAFGTDTIPTMLSPREFTLRSGSATAIERDHPGALGYMNRTGQLPQAGGGMGPVTLVAYIQNPFTGEQVRAVVQAVADDRIDHAVRDAAGIRPGTR